jgi:hypothetical protein
MAEDDRAVKAARAKAMVSPFNKSEYSSINIQHLFLAQETTAKEGRRSFNR